MHPVTLPEPTQKNRRSGATHGNVNSRGLKNKQKPLSEVNKAEATHSFKLSKKTRLTEKNSVVLSMHVTLLKERSITRRPVNKKSQCKSSSAFKWPRFLLYNNTNTGGIKYGSDNREKY
jgi:hypothetical protein